MTTLTPRQAIEAIKAQGGDPRQYRQGLAKIFWSS